MTLITDLTQIKALATQRRDEFEVMGYMLQREEMTDEALDQIVARIAQPIIEAIDCLACGNCCHKLTVYLTPEDGERLKSVIDVPLSAIVSHDSQENVGEWGRFITSPCRFLAGNFCTIYPYRPESCRIYPVFTPDFRWTLDDLIEGAGLCPIIYNVLDQMTDEAERLSRL
jgi:Fe-S-cluster containining protein